MTERDTLINDFLASTGWDKAIRHPIAEDASHRHYHRLIKDQQQAILMDAPPPPVANGKEYAQAARLADHAPIAFAAIAEALYQRGFSAPEILAANINAGLLLLEDLGDNSLAVHLRAQPQQESSCYQACVDMLAALYRASFMPVLSYGRQIWEVRDYHPSTLQVEVDLCLDWYGHAHACQIDTSARHDWQLLWAEILLTLNHLPPGLVLRDFHAENIFWLQDREDFARIGLIDFQDALFGHPAYDLVSLLEDARRNVHPALSEPLIHRFCTQAGGIDESAFSQAYAILGAQRNSKIIGIFTRLAIRDNKPAYLDLIPRIQTHLRHNLTHPALAGLKTWIHRHMPALI